MWWSGHDISAGPREVFYHFRRVVSTVISPCEQHSFVPCKNTRSCAKYWLNGQLQKTRRSGPRRRGARRTLPALVGCATGVGLDRQLAEQCGIAADPHSLCVVVGVGRFNVQGEFVRRHGQGLPQVIDLSE
jgi:hypothetical protein